MTNRRTDALLELAQTQLRAGNLDSATGEQVVGPHALVPVEAECRDLRLAGAGFRIEARQSEMGRLPAVAEVAADEDPLGGPGPDLFLPPPRGEGVHHHRRFPGLGIQAGQALVEIDG